MHSPHLINAFLFIKNFKNLKGSKDIDDDNKVLVDKSSVLQKTYDNSGYDNVFYMDKKINIFRLRQGWGSIQ